MTNLEILAIRLGQVWATARKWPIATLKLRNTNSQDSISVVHHWGIVQSTTVFNLKRIDDKFVITFRGHSLHPTTKLTFRNSAVLFLLLEDLSKLERIIIESDSESTEYRKKYAELFEMYQNPEAIEIMLNEIGEMP